MGESLSWQRCWLYSEDLCSGRPFHKICSVASNAHSSSLNRSLKSSSLTVQRGLSSVKCHFMRVRSVSAELMTFLVDARLQYQICNALNPW